MSKAGFLFWFILVVGGIFYIYQYPVSLTNFFANIFNFTNQAAESIIKSTDPLSSNFHTANIYSSPSGQNFVRVTDQSGRVVRQYYY